MSPSTDTRESREFARELKFVVPPAVAAQIREWAREHLAPDPNAGGPGQDAYRISSLYFDTPSFDVFHRKGSFGRSKYRIRRYGAGDTVFLERKLKTRGLVSKRRSAVELCDLSRMSHGGPHPQWVGRWFHQRLLLRDLRPVCEISYHRTARVGMTLFGPIRLTLDEDIRATALDQLGFNGVHDGVRLAANETILELKFRRDLPAQFKALAEAFVLNAQPHSKYRRAAVALGCVPQAAAASAPSEVRQGTLHCA